ncbi:hypothetical protein J1605_010160 [Eschrichtius robustus]|uniref:Uncharacterized protein n=1 Tax=Eschrichtius robustus TaxID=9764 RepID=A0AB34GU12_ESCRO|nr:hypothetical protein J1605_010160 [Eschrichtius robustus]
MHLWWPRCSLQISNHINLGLSNWALKQCPVWAKLPMSCSQPMPERGRDTKAGSVLETPDSSSRASNWPEASPAALPNLTHKTLNRGFPGGAVVENLPANAGDMGSSPGLGRSHMPRSNWAREPQLLSLRVWSLTSLVAQWLRIRLPMQGIWVRSLVWEDPTCHGATKPVRHNYRACTLEPASHNY